MRHKVFGYFSDSTIRLVIKLSRFAYFISVDIDTRKEIRLMERATVYLNVRRNLTLISPHHPDNCPDPDAMSQQLQNSLEIRSRTKNKSPSNFGNATMFIGGIQPRVC